MALARSHTQNTQVVRDLLVVLARAGSQHHAVRGTVQRLGTEVWEIGGMPRSLATVTVILSI